MGGVVASSRWNRLSAIGCCGPVNVLRTTRYTFCNVDGGLGTVACVSPCLGRPKRAAVAEKPPFLAPPTVLGTERCRSRELGEK